MNMQRDPLPDDVLAALRHGQTIEAIRLLREHTGMGLAECKQAVESFQQRSGGQSGAGSPGEVPRSSGRIWLLAVFVGIAILAYMLSGRPG